MSKMKNYLLCMLVLSTNSLMVCAHAQNPDPNSYALMTAHDMKDSALSNVTITNHTGQPITVAGLYIASYDVNDCSSCTGNIIAGDNVGGTIVTPVTFQTNQSVPIGQNYLYNMVYNGLYFVKTNIGAPCSLPGCSWPGDDPNVHGWCLTMNAASLNSNYTSSEYTNGSHPPASMPPFSQAGNNSAFHYKYALIDPNTLGVGNACIGPVTCDDKTLTCKVSSAQGETFQPYA